MIKDPIVEEVRAVRDSIARKYGYDIHKIVQAIREMEQHSGREYVTLPPRRVTQRLKKSATSKAAA